MKNKIMSAIKSVAKPQHHPLFDVLTKDEFTSSGGDSEEYPLYDPYDYVAMFSDHPDYLFFSIRDDGAIVSASSGEPMDDTLIAGWMKDLKI